MVPRSDWSDERLDALRTLGDPEADALVARHGPAFAAYLRLLTLERPLNGARLAPELPADLREFLARTGRLPDWADPAKLAHAQHLFGRFGLQVVMALLCASLPECYASAKGANILALSRRLTNSTAQRVLETAQFVLDVMAPEAFAPEGRGIRTTQTVRLVHAFARFHLLRHPTYQPDWGVPINAEDSLATMMAFSTVVLQGLERVGVDFTDAEREDYLHAWCAVGALLGIDEGLLPRSWAEGVWLFERVRARHHGPSPAGRELMQALLGLIEELIPGTAFDGFAAVLVRRMVGETVAAHLDLPPEDWTRHFFGSFKGANLLVDRVGDSAGFLARGVESLSRAFLLRGFETEVAKAKGRARLHVPVTLQSAWKVEPPDAGGPREG